MAASLSSAGSCSDWTVCMQEGESCDATSYVVSVYKLLLCIRTVVNSPKTGCCGDKNLGARFVSQQRQQKKMKLGKKQTNTKMKG